MKLQSHGLNWWKVKIIITLTSSLDLMSIANRKRVCLNKPNNVCFRKELYGLQ